MIEVSLTNFIDFVSSVGSSKLTKVKTMKARLKTVYHPSKDYWKKLRDHIVQYHEGSHEDKSFLDKLLDRVPEKKLSNYHLYLQSYKKFLGRKKFQSFDPPTTVWGPPDIKIKINPELGLISEEKMKVIKLYFGSEKISKKRIESIVLLMSEALKKDVPNGTEFGIIDVKEGKYHSTIPDIKLLPLLYGEALSLLTIWNGV